MQNNVDTTTVGITNETESVCDTSIEPSEIYHDNDVIISVQGYNADKNFISIPFLIENNSNFNLGFNARAYSVNRIMTGNNIYDMDCDVAAGKKANVELKIKKDFLDNYNIDSIKSFDILFWAYDNDESFKKFDTGQIAIHTNNYNESFDLISGKCIYDNKNVKIEYLSKIDNKYTYCITNNTGDYFDFDVENITVNDYTSSDLDFDLIGVIVLNSCQAIFTINVSDEFIKLNNLDDIQKIEFALNIRPLEDYSSDWSTDMIVSEDF